MNHDSLGKYFFGSAFILVGLAMTANAFLGTQIDIWPLIRTYIVPLFLIFLGVLMITGKSHHHGNRHCDPK